MGSMFSSLTFFSCCSPCLCVCLPVCVPGWLVDAMEDYSYAFYLSGSCLVVSAAFVVLVDRLIQKRAAQTEGQESDQPAEVKRGSSGSTPLSELPQDDDWT